MSKEILFLADVAAHFQVNEKTARIWIKKGILKSRRKKGMRKHFFFPQDIQGAAL